LVTGSKRLTFYRTSSTETRSQGVRPRFLLSKGSGPSSVFGARDRVTRQDLVVTFKSIVALVSEAVKFFRIPEVLAAIAGIAMFVRKLFFVT